MCVGSGLALLLLNVLYRYGVKGDEERDEEEQARDYFAQHGHWPDETLTTALRGQQRRLPAPRQVLELTDRQQQRIQLGAGPASARSFRRLQQPKPPRSVPSARHASYPVYSRCRSRCNWVSCAPC